MICICTHLHAFASLSGVFSLFSPLNIYISLFYLCLSALSLLPYSSCLHRSPRRAAIRVPLSSVFLPPFLPSSPPPAVCSEAAAACSVLSSVCSSPSCAPPKLSGGLLCVLPCVVCLLPSLVHHQAQDAVAVWADAPRVCPRPFVPLSVMCCRCPFRGFRPCVRVCVLLPCVVWW